VQKLLEGANIKLASVATDVLGVSGRLMLKALIEGKANEKEMAEMAKGRMRSKIPELEKALTGIVSDHHRFMLGEQIAHIDFLDGQIANISQEISVRLEKMSQKQQPPTPSEGNDRTELAEDAPTGRRPEDYVRFCKDADVLIHDSQFTPDEIPKHRGWGHSDYATTLDLALKARAKRLVLFHHAPSRKDPEVTSIKAHCDDLAAKNGADIMIDAAKEGSEFTL